jgi:hypothetical protein
MAPFSCTNFMKKKQKNKRFIKKVQIIFFKHLHLRISSIKKRIVGTDPLSSSHIFGCDHIQG